jgi:hypothetical protein
MRLRRITLEGFRGFMDRRVVEFDDRLTLVYGPNSYGKTSISEGLEWLLYGTTSKLEAAGSKEEYRGSLRNRHVPEGTTAFVEAVFVAGGAPEITLRGELGEGDSIRRLVDGRQVDAWPPDFDVSRAPKPFILQHALKNLLLAKPGDRFQGFAALLGLEELETFRTNVVSLCTKPEACVPSKVRDLRSEVSALIAHCASVPSLCAIADSLSRGADGVSEAYDTVSVECEKRVPPGTKPDSTMSALRRTREEAVAKVFEGSVGLKEYSTDDNESNAADEVFLTGCADDSFVQSYCKLVGLETVSYLLSRAQFFDVGVTLLSEAPAKCPFCGQSVDREVAKHILEEHEELLRQRDEFSGLKKMREAVARQLEDLRQRLDGYHERNAEKVASLLAVEPSIEKLENILGSKHRKHLEEIRTALDEFSPARANLDRLREGVLQALVQVETSVTESRPDPVLVKTLGERALEYVDATRSYRERIVSRAGAMSDAQCVITSELDVRAGTEDIAALIYLVEGRDKVEKAARVEEILSGLRELNRAAAQFVAAEVVKRMSGDLGSEVMKWYQRIKTAGDPDVHFAGFDVPMTAKGDYRAGRIDVKAKSYGVDLVSAVSSLSESKLNALGLCLCIAANALGESPFEFLVIDDPIQSWDAEHGTQFIEVVRSLVGQGTQVVLMSHNRAWLDQLRRGCRAINGRWLEITGYTQAGPHLTELAWATGEQRLRQVGAILKDETATAVTLQQAEEEIRIIVAQLASEYYLKVKGVKKSPHNLNGAKVRKMLLECGTDGGLVDRVYQTFGTTDDAHHAPKDYVPERQRIRRYYDYCWELAQLVKDP